MMTFKTSINTADEVSLVKFSEPFSATTINAAVEEFRDFYMTPNYLRYSSVRCPTTNYGRRPRVLQKRLTHNYTTMTTILILIIIQSASWNPCWSMGFAGETSGKVLVGGLRRQRGPMKTPTNYCGMVGPCKPIKQECNT